MTAATHSATTGNAPDFDSFDSHVQDPVSSEIVQAKWSTWKNFKRLILGGGCAAVLALGVLWWITY